MSRTCDVELAIKLTTEIVVAYMAKNEIEQSTVPDFIGAVRSALTADLPSAVEIDEPSLPVGPASGSVKPHVGEASGAPPADVRLVTLVPAVPIEESVADDYIVSLEDGKHFRSLRRHLMAKYGMTPDDYRQKWNLPDDYPMVAPSFAKDRSEVAKRTGLGRSQVKGRPKARR